MKTHIAIVVTTLACLQAVSTRSYDPHIAGGEEVVPHSHPHQIALLDHNWRFFCGGSIISDRWVITAAHCTKGETLPLYVVIGAHNLSANVEDTRLVINVSSINTHEEFSYKPFQNDISLLRLEKSLTPYIKDGKFIKPIQLPKMSDYSKSYWGSKVTVSGWGRIKDRTSPASPVLKSLNTTVLWNLYCKIRLFRHFNWDEQICTSGYQNMGPCFGDSGGPLTEVESDGEPTLIGIASYISDSSNCMTGGPAGFTRVSSFLEWIKKVTANEVQIRP